MLLPAPGVYLSGSQVMRSHTVFRVAHGATLLGSIEHDAYPFQWYPGGYKGKWNGIAGANNVHRAPYNLARL